MKQHKARFLKWSTAIACALVGAISLVGCNGSNSGPNNGGGTQIAAFTGSYSGLATITQGEGAGTNVEIAAVVGSDGTTRLVVVSDDGNFFTGTTSGSGAFSLTDTDEDGTTTTINGQLTSGGGSGAFQNTAGQSGTVALNKTGASDAALTAQLVGTWRATSIESPAGETASCPGTLSIGVPPEDCGTNDRLTFNANGTLTTTDSAGQMEAGAWSVTGNTLTFLSPDTIVTYRVTVNGSTLRLEELTYKNPSGQPTDNVITNLTRQ